MVRWRPRLDWLNGWQRLWVFLSMLWGAVVLAGGYGAWPAAPAPIRVPLNQVRGPRALDSDAQGNRIPRAYDAHRNRTRWVYDAQANNVAKPLLGMPPQPGFFADLADVAAEQAAKDQATKLAAQQTRIAAASAAAWFVGAFGLYAFGWGVAWVRRGTAAPSAGR